MSWTIALLTASLQTAPAWQEAPVPAQLADVEVRAVEATASGDVWVGVRGRGLAQVRDGAVAWVTEEDGLASSGIADILGDASGRIWAVGMAGYSVFDGDGWEAQPGFGDLRPRVIFGVSEDAASGSVWLAAAGGAGRLVDGGWTVFRQADGLPHQVVHAVVVDREGAAWLACRTGLARVGDAVLDVYYEGVNFRSAVMGSDGVLWFGTSDGVYEWNGSSWTKHLEGTTVYTRLVAADGAIWAGSANAGLFRYADGGWETITLPTRLLGSEVFDVAEGADGAIWVATSSGLGRLVPSQ